MAAANQTMGTKINAGVAFKPVNGKPGDYPYTLLNFDSDLWASYTGAYGDVREYLSIVLGDRDNAPETLKLRRLENIPKSDYEIAFDNLCETLWHQMSFYKATWLVLPYLAKLMEKWEKQGDWEWVFKGILAAGSILATDVFRDKPAEESIDKSYQNAARHIRAMTLNFLALHLENVLEKENYWKQEFAVAVSSILGEKKLAFMLYMSAFDTCYIVCPNCEDCNEEIELDFGSDEAIEQAELPAELWDGESLEDVKLWLFNLFFLLGDEEGINYLRHYFGTYVCPECGEKTAVFTAMEEYYFS